MKAETTKGGVTYHAPGFGSLDVRLSHDQTAILFDFVTGNGNNSITQTIRLNASPPALREMGLSIAAMADRLEHDQGEK